MTPANTRPFIKMNGLGNDFIVIEDAAETFDPTPDEVRGWANRETGVGFDQLIAISKNGAQPHVRFWNSDGEEVGACGNGSRCVGWLLMQAAGVAAIRFRTDERELYAEDAGERMVSLDMGQPRLDWREIPLAEEMDTRGIELQVGPIDEPHLHTPGAVSMGNPHVVFFVDDIDAIDVARDGSLIENHPLFPQGVNVGFAQIKAPDHIRLRVWERGAGLTKACGTGACAALVAAHRRGKTGRKARLELDGGDLVIEWREADDHVIMTGPIEVEFTGVL